MICASFHWITELNYKTLLEKNCCCWSFIYIFIWSGKTKSAINNFMTLWLTSESYIAIRAVCTWHVKQEWCDHNAAMYGLIPSRLQHSSRHTENFPVFQGASGYLRANAQQPGSGRPATHTWHSGISVFQYLKFVKNEFADGRHLYKRCRPPLSVSNIHFRDTG